MEGNFHREQPGARAAPHRRPPDPRVLWHPGMGKLDDRGPHGSSERAWPPSLLLPPLWCSEVVPLLELAPPERLQGTYRQHRQADPGEVVSEPPRQPHSGETPAGEGPGGAHQGVQ